VFGTLYTDVRFRTNNYSLEAELSPIDSPNRRPTKVADNSPQVRNRSPESNRKSTRTQTNQSSRRTKMNIGLGLYAGSRSSLRLLFLSFHRQ